MQMWFDHKTLSLSLGLTDRMARIPEPPAGHRWKEVRHDNSVTWLASWTENIQGSIKYVMLNANSKLKVLREGSIRFKLILLV